MLADEMPRVSSSGNAESTQLFGTRSPVKSKVTAVKIGDRLTDISLMDFRDKLFVVLSQYQKLGTLVYVTRDVALNGECQEPVYSTRILLGRDEVEIHAVARLIAGTLRCNKGLLLGLALEDFSPKTVCALANILVAEASTIT